MVVIIGLAASVTAVSLAAAGDQGRWHAAVAQCRDLDGRARLHASVEGPLVLDVDQDGGRLWLHRRGASGAVAELILPSGVRVEVRPERPAEVVEFDRRGRSPDYLLRLDGDDRHVTLTVCGLTGLVTEEPP